VNKPKARGGFGRVGGGSGLVLGWPSVGRLGRFWLGFSKVLEVLQGCFRIALGAKKA